MALQTMTDRSLLIYFNKYNRKYFGNKLKLAFIRFVPDHHKLMRGCMGRTIPFDQIDANGNIIKRNSCAKIFINARYRRDPRVTLPTLLHEMNHMAHPQVKDCKKSPTFEKGMRRLAARGAMERLW
jgi:hypothetical protein